MMTCCVFHDGIYVLYIVEYNIHIHTYMDPGWSARKSLARELTEYKLLSISHYSDYSQCLLVGELPDYRKHLVTSQIRVAPPPPKTISMVAVYNDFPEVMQRLEEWIYNNNDRGAAVVKVATINLTALRRAFETMTKRGGGGQYHQQQLNHRRLATTERKY